MLHRTTLVLSLEAVSYFERRLTSLESQLDKYINSFHTLNELAAICAANPTQAADSQVFDAVRAEIVENAMGSPQVVVTLLLIGCAHKLATGYYW